MLTQERQSGIVRLVQQHGAMTVTELADIYQTSSSTIRRDLTALDEQHLLHKVFGGATALIQNQTPLEESLESKQQKNIEAKISLARYAAGLIEPQDLVYIDAGSTTEQLSAFIMEKTATYVTNSIPLSCKLAKRGFNVRLVGGIVKPTTEAVIGSQARQIIQKLNFNIGFFGANGVTIKEGYTTPEMEEAEGKSTALTHCKRPFILADASKVGIISGVSFAPLKAAGLITNQLMNQDLKNHTLVKEVDQL